jgi:hypothetical protein
MSAETTDIPPDIRTLLATISRRLGQSEHEILIDALYQYARVHDPNWPKSIGAAWDSEVTGENSEDWLRDNWHPD